MAITTTAYFGFIGVNELKYRRNRNFAAQLRRTGRRAERKGRRLRFKGLARNGGKARRDAATKRPSAIPPAIARRPRDPPLSAAARIALRALPNDRRPPPRLRTERREDSD
jgi:hypothetical protein